jgi:hypothetical protein
MLGVLLHASRGPFYSPKAVRSRWRSTWKANLAFSRVVHWTVRCTTGREQFLSSARFPSISGADDRWTRAPLAHRTVRWFLAAVPSPFPESDEFVAGVVVAGADDSPDSLVIYSHVAPAKSREQPVRRRASLGTRHCPVHHRLMLVGWTEPNLLHLFYSFLGYVSST